MRLDDGMGYDRPHHQQRARQRLRITRPLIIAAVLAVAVIALIASTVAAPRPPATTQPAPPNPVPPVAGPAVSASPTAARPVTPTPGVDGHDADEQAGAAQEVWGTFEAFMGAWCSTDPAIRRQGFADTATVQLAQGLAETRPENVITAARTKVEVVGAGPYSAEFRVWFEDVATSVHVILVADPGSPHGWRVTRVEKRGD